MITIVHVPSALNAGARDSLILDGDGPFEVKIRCFIDYPPPPDYRHCDACGVFRLREHVPLEMQASKKTFPSGGELHIEIQSAAGDLMTLRIPVFAVASIGG